MADKKEIFKRLYNLKKELVVEANDVGRALDAMIEEEFGFNYSQTDDDPMIDTLDYGTQNLSFEDFIETMTDYKKQVEEGDFFLNA